MAMRSATRSELNKLRELMRFMLREEHCFFCKKLIFNDGDQGQCDGDGRGKPIATQITIHHVDGNHSNQKRSNKRLAHTSCHKKFHARLWWEARRAA